MHTKFILEIEMCNAEMYTEEHVSVALHKVADRIITHNTGRCPIRDVNGNKVGYFEFKEIDEITED